MVDATRVAGAARTGRNHFAPLHLLRMFENRNRQLDILALVLLATTFFVGVSLATYDHNDPPAQAVFPAPTTVANACGFVGAFASHHLYQSLGGIAWYAWGSLAAVTAILAWRSHVNQPAVRVAGWVLSVVALTALASMLFPNWTPGPLVGAGGYLGAMGRTWLESHFATAGTYIFALSVLAAGLLLSTDYALLHVAAATGALAGKSLVRAGAFAGVARVKTDLENEFAEVDGENDEEDEEAEYEYEYEEEDEEEEAHAGELTVRTPTSRSDDQAAPVEGAKTTFRERVSSALGIVKAANEVENVEPLPVKKKPKSEREVIIEQLQKADQRGESNFDYELPPLDLLNAAEDFSYEEQEKEVRRKAKLLEKAFESFGLNIKVVAIETGPVIAQYEVQLEKGLRLAKVTSLSDDLAIALRVPSVRIVAPIPGKNTVGIEVPNEKRQLVRLREVIEETDGQAKRMKIPIYLGQDVAGNPMVVDLAALPHLLIAGRTGTGKSVCLNSIIVSILMSRGPDEVRMLMIDPKMVELSGYRKLPHLMHPVVTDMKKAEAILAWAVDKMEERYQLLARAGVRHVSVYNQLGEEELRDRVQPNSEEEWSEIPKQLPFIVIVADEMADLMMTAGKDVEQHIIRLAQKSRAVGIHLILATQKPTVDVITGLIKSNLPARIAFQVASRTDSRVVLDENGADKLLGNGDMLFLSPGTSLLLRGQGTYLSDDEITRVVDYVGTEEPQFAGELMQLQTKEEVEATAGSLKNRDELYEAAVDIVVREGRGSVSLLQRALGIGYGRAARLIDFMAEDRIVGEYNGSQAREVSISVAEWEAMRGGAAKSPAVSAGRPVAADVAPRNVETEADEVAEVEGDDDEVVDADEYEESDDNSDAGDGEHEYEEDAEDDDSLWEEPDSEAAEIDEEDDETEKDTEAAGDDEEYDYEYEYEDEEEPETESVA